jgi:hypothetical protein
MTTLTEDAIALHALKLAYDSRRVAAQEAKGEMDRAENAFWNRMEAERCSGHKVDGIGNFVRSETIYAAMQDKHAFIEWAEAEMPELLDPDPKPRMGLLNALVNDLLDNNQPLPPGLGFYPKPYVSQRVA